LGGSNATVHHGAFIRAEPEGSLEAHDGQPRCYRV
jgi:hypothetical protein